jgi:hypothetical protein
LIVILSSGAVFAQGKGHGKGGGGGDKHADKHGGGEKRGWGGEMRGGDQQRFERPQFQQREQRQEQRAQPRWERPQMQREVQRVPPGWQKQEQRQQAWRVEQQRRPEIRQIPDNRGFEQWRNQGDREAKKQRRYDVSQRVWQRQVPWMNGSPRDSRDYGQFRNYGQYRSNEVHIRNAERKAWKDEEKSFRFDRRYSNPYEYRTERYYRNNDYYRDNRYYRDNGQYRNDRYYRNNGYDYQYPQQTRATVLRNLIASVLGANNRSDSNYYYSQARPVYYTNQYYPVNYGGSYYNSYPQYQSYAIAPTYYSYQPYGYAYEPQDGDPYYSGYGDNVLFSDYSSSFFGGGIVQQIFSNLLALGYEQGYTRGLQARRAGYGDRYYYDPYDYGDNSYISYSNTLGENRRCLSEGYELGYRDALYNQRGVFGYQNIDPYQDTNVDLVSVLIGSALQSFSS